MPSIATIVDCPPDCPHEERRKNQEKNQHMPYHAAIIDCSHAGHIVHYCGRLFPSISKTVELGQEVILLSCLLLTFFDKT